MITSKQHKKILSEIRKHQGHTLNKRQDNDSYLSSGHHYYQVSVPTRRKIAKDWIRQNKGISQKDFVKLLDSLYKGESHEEKSVASILVGYFTSRREDLRPKHLDRWLNYLVGWAEVDSLCQNVFTAGELLEHWDEWKPFIQKLSQSKNINKRRASLVLLTGPTYRSDDVRLKNLAFEIIDRLKHEKEIIITKAISWLLRDMTYKHKNPVSDYLRKNESTLPKVALRETWRKIKTGRK